MKKLSKALPLVFLMPGVALAQGGGTGSPDLGWFTTLANELDTLVNALIPIAIALGLLFFIWGLVQFIASSGDEGAKDEGKRKMIWGLVALFVIVAVWGLVGLLANIVGVSIGGTINPPTAP